MALRGGLASAAAGGGQVPSPTGNVYGTALDPEGKPLAGATATLIGPGAAQTAVSDARGDFRFLRLSPGEYSVTLERPGFATARRSVTVALGNVGPFGRVAGRGSGGGCHGRRRRARPGQPRGPDRGDVRPEGARQHSDDAGSVGDPATGSGRPARQRECRREAGAQQVPFVGKGSPGGQNSYNLDGAAISMGASRRCSSTSIRWTRSRSTTGGSDLALASPGVALNLVTKRGTNELKGSARAYYTGGAGWDYGVEAGGPLWRDRVWLWGAFAHNDYHGHPFLNVRRAPREPGRLEQWNAKLDARPVPANALTLAYTHFDRTFWAGDTGPDKSAGIQLDQLSSGAVLQGRGFPRLLGQALRVGLLLLRAGLVADLPVGGLDEQADWTQRASGDTAS